MTIEQLLNNLCPIPSQGETAIAYAQIRRNEIREAIENHTNRLCRLTMSNTKKLAIETLNELHPLGVKEVEKQIVKLKWKSIKPNPITV